MHARRPTCCHRIRCRQAVCSMWSHPVISHFSTRYGQGTVGLRLVTADIVVVVLTMRSAHELLCGKRRLELPGRHHDPRTAGCRTNGRPHLSLRARKSPSRHPVGGLGTPSPPSTDPLNLKSQGASGWSPAGKRSRVALERVSAKPRGATAPGHPAASKPLKAFTWKCHAAVSGVLAPVFAT